MNRSVLEDPLCSLLLMTSGISDRMYSYAGGGSDRSSCQYSGSRIVRLHRTASEETGLTNCTVVGNTCGRAIRPRVL